MNLSKTFTAAAAILALTLASTANAALPICGEGHAATPQDAALQVITNRLGNAEILSEDKINANQSVVNLVTNDAGNEIVSRAKTTCGNEGCCVNSYELD